MPTVHVHEGLREQISAATVALGGQFLELRFLSATADDCPGEGDAAGLRDRGLQIPADRARPGDWEDL